MSHSSQQGQPTMTAQGHQQRDFNFELQIAKLFAEISQILADIRKKDAESEQIRTNTESIQTKHEAEIAKLMAETAKLNAETVKISKQTFWYPLGIAIGLVSAIATIVKLFF